jgi:hypothetical protein
MRESIETRLWLSFASEASAYPQPGPSTASSVEEMCARNAMTKKCIVERRARVYQRRDGMLNDNRCSYFALSLWQLVEIS